uniref:Pericentrin/AKAP-450 centrosomal targeting domain-containing protein n=1 Tax=Magallana gigas TaxID=29159 RepID=A0A8W8MAH7_MAGGI
MEATRELQQEKLRSTHQRVDSEGSEEDPDHWNIYKTQLESICQGMQYLILQDQDQPFSGVEGSVNVQSLEKSFKDLLRELKQPQTPLALESDTMDSLTSRPSAQAVNQRVLQHNSELTNFVSRLTEEKMELRNTLGRLEEEMWRYRQRGTEQQLALFQMEQELDQSRADLRVERDQKSGIAGVGTEGDRDRIQRLYGKYPRADSYRKALVYQKKYLLLLLGGFQDCEQTTLALIARMGVYPSPEDLQQGIRPRRLVTTSRSATTVMVADAVLGQEVEENHQSGIPRDGGYSRPPTSFTQRHLLNGASPYHSLGGASSGYHVNSNGVTNEISSYQSVGGVFDSYHVNRNFSVYTTPPTRDYSSKPHPTQVLEEKLSPLPFPPPQKSVTHLQHVEYSKVKVISTEIGGRSRDIVKTLLSS